MRYPKVTIIILNYNGFNDTKKCLKAIAKTKYSNFKVIIADNGSSENEAETLKKTYIDKRFQFVRFNKNLGFSGGNNKILKYTKSKYVILLNNDTQVPPNWLAPLIKTMEKDNSIAVAQPKILWLKNKKYFDYSGACGGFIDMFGYPFTRGRIFDTQEVDKGQYNSMKDIFWASGAAMILRRSIFDKVGYFDELFFNYMEEIDLCFRIRKAGFRIVCEPKSYIFHKVASTASRQIFKKRYWEHRNNLLLILKNYSTLKIILFFPLRIFFEYLSLFYYIRHKKIKYALAVLLSQLSLVRFGPIILWRKTAYKQTKAAKINKTIYKGSIILSYFILRKRTYKEISPWQN